MAGEGMYIDHVIYGVVDVEAAAERLRREHPGFRSLEVDIRDADAVNAAFRDARAAASG